MALFTGAAPAMPELLIDGEPATAIDLAPLALVNYGGFTLMRVEQGAVRGLDLHLARLHDTAVELFGSPVPERRLRDLMRLAVARWPGPVTLRVNLFSHAVTVRDPSSIGPPSVMTTVSAAGASSTTPLRLTTAVHRRETPHLKHVATFGVIRERRLALAAGFDDVVFVDKREGQGAWITEGSIWNIGFVQGSGIVWPLAPMLSGTGQALIQRGLDAHGVPTETRPVRLDEIATFDGAFAVNAMTPGRPIAAIGDVVFCQQAPDPRLEAARNAMPLELI